MRFDQGLNGVEVAHVLANDEGLVATENHLVVHQGGWVHQSLSLKGILWIAELVIGADEHGSGHGDLREVDLWWSLLAVVLLVQILRTPVVEFHVALLDQLGVMDQTLDADSIWEVSHVYLESILVIQRNISGGDKELQGVAN